MHTNEKIRKHVFLIFVFLVLPLLQSTEIKYCYNDDISSVEALKNLNSLIVFSRFPASSPEEADVLRQTIIQELKTIGTVVQKPLPAKTPSDQDALDYANFPMTDGSMICEITQLVDAQAKELPIVMVSVKVICETNINKTKEMTSAVVWNRSYFFSGNVHSDLKSLVKKSFAPLLEDFSTSYKKANIHRPNTVRFYLLNLDLTR